MSIVLDPGEARNVRRAGVRGTDTMASARGIVPWHKNARAGLLNASGERTAVLAGSDATAEEFIRAAGLDWDVAVRDLFLADGTPVPTNRVVVRVTDGMQLGVVSSKYVPVQNTAAFAMMDAYVKAGFGTFETAGSLWDGRTVYVSILAKASFEVLPGDSLESYLVLSNTHDGSGAVQAVHTFVRPVCGNTLRRGKKAGRCVWSIRHTRNVNADMQNAVETDVATRNRALAMGKNAVAMTEKQLSTASLVEFIRESLHPVRQSDAERDTDEVLSMLGGIDALAARERTRAEKRLEAQVQRCLELADHGRGTDIPGVKGTVWGALNAVTEYASHEYPTRGSSLAQSILEGTAGGLIERAVENAMQLIRVTA